MRLEHWVPSQRKADRRAFDIPWWGGGSAGVPASGSLFWGPTWCHRDPVRPLSQGWRHESSLGSLRAPTSRPWPTEGTSLAPTCTCHIPSQPGLGPSHDPGSGSRASLGHIRGSTGPEQDTAGHADPQGPGSLSAGLASGRPRSTGAPLRCSGSSLLLGGPRDGETAPRRAGIRIVLGAVTSSEHSAHPGTLTAPCPTLPGGVSTAQECLGPPTGPRPLRTAGPSPPPLPSPPTVPASGTTLSPLPLSPASGCRHELPTPRSPCPSRPQVSPEHPHADSAPRPRPRPPRAPHSLTESLPGPAQVASAPLCSLLGGAAPHPALRASLHLLHRGRFTHAHGVQGGNAGVA